MKTSRQHTKKSQYSTEHHTIGLFEIDRTSALFCSESIKTTILEADCPVANMADTFYSVISKPVFEHIYYYTASQTTSDLRQMNEVHLGLLSASWERFSSTNKLTDRIIAASCVINLAATETLTLFNAVNVAHIRRTLDYCAATLPTTPKPMTSPSLDEEEVSFDPAMSYNRQIWADIHKSSIPN
jgi:hypothetical protein